MTTFTYPTLTKDANRGVVRIVANAAALESPWGSVQTLGRTGSRLGLTLYFDGRTGADRGELQGFIAGLFGQQHRVQAGQPDYSIRGAGGGTPTVNGASQVGASLDISGGPVSQSGWLKRGDQISFSNGTWPELKIVTADVDTDGSGQATIPIFPEIHVSPSNGASVELSAPVGQWLQMANENSWSLERVGKSAFVLDLIEDIVFQAA